MTTNWVRCPSCGERARAAKTKDDGTVKPVQLRNGAWLYECGTPAKDCGLRLGVFTVYIKEDGGIVYESKGNLEAALDEFHRHARVVEDCIQGIRRDPLGSRGALSVLVTSLEHLGRAASEALREVP